MITAENIDIEYNINKHNAVFYNYYRLLYSTASLLAVADALYHHSHYTINIKISVILTNGPFPINTQTFELGKLISTTGKSILILNLVKL